MKKLLIACLFLTSLSTVHAEENLRRVNFTFGGGPQKYKGDLGNGFFHKGCCWYGGMGITLSYKINRSFDFGYFGYIGDYNFVQPEEMVMKSVDPVLQCVGCIDRTGLGDLKSRITSSGLFIRYKIGSQCDFLTKIKVQPYIQLGAAYNYVSDRMKMNCVNEGHYYSLNGAIGLKYQINDRFSIGIQSAFGYFTNDAMDNISYGNNDMYMQNSLILGISLF